MTLDIVSLGEPLIEFNETDGRHVRGVGGDASNFAVAAARQGVRVGMIGAIGDDAHGRLLLDLWAREGVDVRGVRVDPESPTGVYFVTHGATGHHFDFARRGSAASLHGARDLERPVIEEARLLHLTGISFAISLPACDAAYAAIGLARGAGRMISFDTNLRLRLWPRDRARAIILDVMGLADISLPSLEDVAALTGIDDPDRLADDALRRGARIVALKLGAKGSLVASAQERHRIPPFPCRAIDATGAGDAFGGAFVTRILAGDGLLEAGRYAAVTAALSTEGFGAVDPVPRREEVEAALARWPREV